METKPKGRVYWTAKHIKHDEAGVLVIGRTVIPMVVIYISALVGAAALAVYGIIASPKGPKGYIAEWSGFIPLAWYGGILAATTLIIGVSMFISWVIRTIRNAQDGLDKSRWDY